METLAYLLVSQDYECQDYKRQDYETRRCFSSDLEAMPLNLGHSIERLAISPLNLSNLAAMNLVSLSCVIWLLGLCSGAIAQTYDSDGLYPSSIYAFTADQAYSDRYSGSSTAYLLPETSIYPSDTYAYIQPDRAIASPCGYATPYAGIDSTAGYVPIAPANSLQVGDSGNQVRSLQDLLRNAGYFSSTSTGYFGSATKSAVTAFQQDYGLMVDGIAGSQTIAALQGRS